ncbi:MAG TPA: TlpA disulfide reductase family protein [Gemmatimonadales bacterium]|nr:TlpA disulfide reductase family protein [Gemmatimonadales bacterium]
MSRQWMVVILIVAGLAIGATALVRVGSGMDRVEVGSRMPDFRVTDPHTRDTLSLREHYKGSVTLVNIWATWCVPCRTEMPAMEQVYREYKDRGFRIAAVSVDEAADDAVNQFTENMGGFSFDILHDRSGDIQKVYQTTGVPESFLVNQEGIIVRRIIGAHDWNSALNRSLIERLLAETKPTSGVAAR